MRLYLSQQNSFTVIPVCDSRLTVKQTEDKHASASLWMTAQHYHDDEVKLKMLQMSSVFMFWDVT